MELISGPDGPIELATTPIHLGLGATAIPVVGWSWDPAAIDAYVEATAADGEDGRLVMWLESSTTWDHWERHPLGEEVVICVAGRLTMIQELEHGLEHFELGPGAALVNPRGVWHTADIHEPGHLVTVTAGIGTEHRLR